MAIANKIQPFLTIDAQGQAEACPRCAGLVRDDGDDASRELACGACGWRAYLLADGRPYQPPPPETHTDQGEGWRRWRNDGYLPRLARDGCRHHPTCQTCPFEDCIAGYKSISRNPRDAWFEGRPVAELTGADVFAEMERCGISERNAYKRLEVLRREGRRTFQDSDRIGGT